MSCLSVRAPVLVWYVGDLLPALVLEVSEDGRRFDFTGWTLVLTADGPVTVTGAAAGDALGNITYSWASGQTAMPGDYAVYVVVTSPAPAKQRTFRLPDPVSIRRP